MMNNEIRYRVEFTIEGSKIEEYKTLVQDMVRLVEANEPDTINYEFYLNKAETSCVVNETYANSEAALAHRKGVAIQTILFASMLFIFTYIVNYALSYVNITNPQFCCSILKLLTLRLMFLFPIQSP